MAKAKKNTQQQAAPAARTVPVSNKPEVTLQQNIADLQRSTKFLGFGDTLDKEIAEKRAAMKPGDKHFAIETSKFYMKPGSKENDLSTQDKMTYTLNYERGKGDTVYLNNYKAELSKLVKMEDGSLAPQHREHTFYVNRSGTVTAKEAYNLLDERAVYKKDITNKDGEKYNAWVTMDFVNLKDGKPQKKIYNDQYGFDMPQALGGLQLKESKNEKSAKFLTEGLYKGDLRPATLLKDPNDEKGQKIYIAADPKFKNFKQYNEDGTKLFQKRAPSMKH